MSSKVSKSKNKHKKNTKYDFDDSIDCSNMEHSNISSDKSNTTKEYTSYLIINDDLKMSKGKIAAQSAHAILNVYRFMTSTNTVNEAWEKCGEKIVALKASGEIIMQILSEYGTEHIAKKNKLNVFPVFDAGRTEVAAGSLTVIATTPISDDIKPDILKILKLL
jgi:PTH2 family peptidyl-tRNA hydrolase